MAEVREAQSLSVKRAEVEFHGFASLGEPERARGKYEAENSRRGAIIAKHLPFFGQMTPFLEIGANVGHTSYFLANDYNARGFASDISLDSLRWGIELQKHWGYQIAPVRMAGDALHLPFKDNSMRLVMAFQMLSQFQDINAVLEEVKRVLAPGGVFYFAEEPLRRALSLRLYRAPYYDNMRPWERKLFDWGLLGFVVQDVIGAHQEESFGIRQNHRMTLRDWHELVRKHFPDYIYEIFVPRRGWGESFVANAARRFDSLSSDWLPARLLGGTLAGICKKPGGEVKPPFNPEHFERSLRCPDCQADVIRDHSGTIRCTRCIYAAADEGGVYNLLSTKLRDELYPGDRDDILDFTQPAHEKHLREGWWELEGVYGNKYRWIGESATAVLRKVDPSPQRIRIRAFAAEQFLKSSGTAVFRVKVNGQQVGSMNIDRTGVFIFEADLPDAVEYQVEISATPAWTPSGDDRRLTVNVSMMRLIPREA